ncbi:hypothetical protein BDK51DRAFT_44460, partial [Blyttiomyces helicus]
VRGSENARGRSLRGGATGVTVGRPEHDLDAYLDAWIAASKRGEKKESERREMERKESAKKARKGRHVAVAAGAVTIQLPNPAAGQPQGPSAPGPPSLASSTSPLLSATSPPLAPTQSPTLAVPPQELGLTLAVPPTPSLLLPPDLSEDDEPTPSRTPRFRGTPSRMLRGLRDSTTRTIGGIVQKGRNVRRGMQHFAHSMAGRGEGEDVEIGFEGAGRGRRRRFRRVRKIRPVDIDDADGDEEYVDAEPDEEEEVEDDEDEEDDEEDDEEEDEEGREEQVSSDGGVSDSYEDEGQTPPVLSAPSRPPLPHPFTARTIANPSPSLTPPPLPPHLPSHLYPPLKTLNTHLTPLHASLLTIPPLTTTLTTTLAALQTALDARIARVNALAIAAKDLGAKRAAAAESVERLEAGGGRVGYSVAVLVERVGEGEDAVVGFEGRVRAVVEGVERRFGKVGG